MPSWVEIVLRSIAALAALFIFTRILGKKQISQLTYFEYVVGITLGGLAGFISTDMEAHFFLGLLAMFVWFIIPLGFEFLTLKSLRLRKWLEGTGSVLIQDGKVMEDNLKKERMTADELMEQLRVRDVFRIADVEVAVLESSGELSVMRKRDKQPLTPRDIGMKLPREKEPQTVIIDGKILDEQLAGMGLSRGWLNEELEKAGVTAENVFLGQVDAYQQLYIDLYDDKIETKLPQAKSLLYASLKKIQADLELFALSTRDPGAKSMYSSNAKKLEKVIQELKPVLEH
jgi:uncharacterized membrane protein YcaP (DUF421 family)